MYQVNEIEGKMWEKRVKYPRTSVGECVCLFNEIYYRTLNALRNGGSDEGFAPPFLPIHPLSPISLPTPSQCSRHSRRHYSFQGTISAENFYAIPSFSPSISVEDPFHFELHILSLHMYTQNYLGTLWLCSVISFQFYLYYMHVLIIVQDDIIEVHCTLL